MVAGGAREGAADLVARCEIKGFKRERTVLRNIQERDLLPRGREGWVSPARLLGFVLQHPQKVGGWWKMGVLLTRFLSSGVLF